MYKDASGTMPAEEGDYIVLIRDDIGGSGFSAIQENVQQQAIFVFDEDGIPAMWSDGVDDCYVSAASLAIQQWFFRANVDPAAAVALCFCSHNNTGSAAAGRLFPNVNTLYNGDANDVVGYATNGTGAVNGAHTNIVPSAKSTISLLRTSAYSAAQTIVNANGNLGGQGMSGYSYAIVLAPDDSKQTEITSYLGTI